MLIPAPVADLQQTQSIAMGDKAHGFGIDRYGSGSQHVGGQVFFVHNRVESIDRVARRIGELVPDARIAVAHGQMNETALEQVIVDFWDKQIDVLVCTTIVESGIDIAVLVPLTYGMMPDPDLQAAIC